MYAPHRIKIFCFLILTTLLLATGHTARAQEPIPEERFFSQTGYIVDNDRIWDYFQARGGVETFGYPISRTFRFRGLEVQLFQRHVIQVVGDRARPLNLLDPVLMPVTEINNATFPAHNPDIATAAPTPDTPNYHAAVRQHLDAVVPNSWEGQTVGFRNYYQAAAPTSGNLLVALEVWGFPTSEPARDPANHNFIYQRFQRGILHYDASSGVTRGILLGQAFRDLLRGQDMPADFERQMADSPFLGLYEPNAQLSLAREVPTIDPPITQENTNLTNAFVPVDGAGLFNEVTVYLVDLSRSDRTSCAVTLAGETLGVEPTRTPLKTAIEELVLLGQSSAPDRYNAAFLTHGVRLESVTVQDETARIRFSGEYSTNESCDLEWFATQVRQTAMQFDTVDEVEIFIGGQPLEVQGLPIEEQVQIHLIALEDNGQNGKPIGCDDSVVPVTRSVQPTSRPLRAALEALFAIDQMEVGESGLYNALWQADLAVDRIEFENGNAQVYLTGQPTRGGVCDDPRFEAQIRETVLQFEEIDSTEIFINGEPMDLGEGP